MARTPARGRRRSSARPASPLAPGDAEALVARVRAELAAGRDKQALEAAKDLRRRHPGPTSDAAYLEAAQARVEGLLRSGQHTAARQLADLLGQLFPQAQAATRDTALRADLRAGRPEPVLRALAAQGLSRERRRELFALLEEDLGDPDLLARSDVLPEAHPLRRDARAACALLDRATAGPCDADALAREAPVPAGSPLVCWQLLAVGIAAAQAKDLQGVERVAASMSPRARPARLLPALRALAADEPGTGLPLPLRRLVEQVRGDGGLADDLRALDRAIEADRDGESVRLALRIDETLCRVAPAHVDDFRILACARWVERDPMPDPLRRFFHIRGLKRMAWYGALGFEIAGDPLSAIGAWSAVVDSPDQPLSPADVARIRLRQARLVGDDGPSCTCSLCASLAEDEDDEGLARPFLEEAVALDPSPSTWAALVDHLDATDPAAAEKAARAWAEACPDDLAPLLRLLAAAERRGAVRKALRVLERAEALGPTHPAVRQGRWRLHLEGARQRLQQGKARLARRDLDALRAQPLAGARPARLLLDALQWHAADRMADAPGRDAALAALDAAIGAGGAALLLREAREYVRGRGAPACGPLPALPTRVPAPQAAVALAAIEQVFAETTHAPLPLPGWTEGLRQALAEGFEPADADLESLCRRATRDEDGELLFRLSGVGLRRDGAQRHRYLCFRARALGALGGFGGLARRRERRGACLEVARALARQVRDEAWEREIQHDLNAHHAETSLRSWLRGKRRDFEPRHPAGADPDAETVVRVLAEEAHAALEDVTRRRAVRRAQRPAPLRQRADAGGRQGALFDEAPAVAGEEPS